MVVDESVGVFDDVLLVFFFPAGGRHRGPPWSRGLRDGYKGPDGVGAPGTMGGPLMGGCPQQIKV